VKTIELLTRMSAGKKTEALAEASRQYNCHPLALRQAMKLSTQEALSGAVPAGIAYQNAAMQMGATAPEDIVYSLPAYDQLIQDLELFDNALLPQIPRLPGKGIGSLVQTRTATGVDWHDGYVLDNAARAPAKGTYATNLSRFKILYRSVDISIPLILMTQDVTDVKRNEIDKQMEEMQEVILKGFFYGDETTYAQEWDGLVNLVDSNHLVHNTTTNGGADFDYDKFKEAFHKIDGSNKPSAILMTEECQLKFSSYLEENYSQRLEYGEIEGGFWVYMYLGVPIITCKVITNAQTYDGTETTNWESGGECTSIFFVRWNNLRFKELLPLGLYQLGLNSALLSQYDIFGMRTLELRHVGSLVILDGIDVSSDAASE